MPAVGREGLTERLLRRDRAVLVSLIALLFVLAAIYTVFGVGMDMSALDMTAMRGMTDMPGQRAPGDWSPGYAFLVFLMWWVMMVAMMLPSASPTVLLYAAVLRHGTQRNRVPAISSVFVAGYLSVWAGFSGLAAILQWFLESRELLSATMMTLTESLPGALLLMAAGAFQLSPLKAACLSHCQSPADYITRRRRPGIRGALVMGLEHGAFCVGCCWSLMALLFFGGIMNLFWIVGLATFVAVEKLTPFGMTLGRIAGVALIAWGAWTLLDVL